jgi:hypothetical protein
LACSQARSERVEGKDSGGILGGAMSTAAPRRAAVRGAFVAAAAVALLAACSRIDPIDQPPPSALSQPERVTVRAQVAKAVEARRWKDAWNQEIRAGGDRRALEEIAVKALADDDAAAEDMLDELRRRHGALSPEGHAAVRSAAQDEEARKEWARAAEILVAAADDPPEYGEAWGVYARTPPNKALDVLDVIQDARREHEEDERGEAGAQRSGAPR